MSNKNNQRGMSNMGRRGGNQDRGGHNFNHPVQHAQPPPPLLNYPHPVPQQYPIFPPNPPVMYSYSVPPTLQYPHAGPAPYQVHVTVNQEPRGSGEYYHDKRETPPRRQERGEEYTHHQQGGHQYQRSDRVDDRYSRSEQHHRGNNRESQRSSPPPPYIDRRHERGTQGRHGCDFGDAPPPYDSVVPRHQSGDVYRRQRADSTGSEASVGSRSSYKSNNEQRFNPKTDSRPNRPQGQNQDPKYNKKKEDIHEKDGRGYDLVGQRQKYGQSMDKLPSQFDTESDRRRDDGCSRGRFRGRGGDGRGRGRGRGRGASQLNSKFSSTQSLVDVDLGKEEESERVKRQPRQRPNRSSNNQDGRNIQPREEGKPRVTKAALQILKSFNGADHLKHTVRQHLDQQESELLRIVEESIICSELRGLCTVMVTTDNKQLAKRIIKDLCQKLRKSLQVNVTFEISSSDEGNAPMSKEQRFDYKEKVPMNINPTRVSTRRKAAEKFLAFASQRAPRIQKTGYIKKEKNQTDLDSQADTDSAANTRRSPESNKQQPKKGADNEVVSIPTKISVTIGMCLIDKPGILSFLRSIIDEKESTYELIEDTLAITSSKTLFDLMAPSKAAASRIVKTLNALKMGDSTVRAHVVGDPSLKDGSAKSDKIKSVIQSTLDEMERMSSSALDIHGKTIENYEKALDAMQKESPGDEEDEEDVLEELALRDRLMEVIKMMSEFKSQHEILVEKVKKMDSASTTTNDLKDLLQMVEINCNRLTTALPILAKRKDILSSVQANQVLVLCGETGLGKSSQLVQYLYEAGLAKDGRIICTQPRQLAAVVLAEHVAKEMSGKVGGTVGYTTNSTKLVNANTRIVFSTDHYLLNKSLKNPTFTGYSCIIVDEAQDRSIYTDLLLGIIKNCLPSRPDLKVIIVLSSHSGKNFISYLNSGTEVHIPGRLFPVDVVYESSESLVEFEQYEVKAVAKAVSVHKTEGPGDILVFLASPVEIMRCLSEFEKRMSNDTKYKCFPLHEMLSPSELKKAFDPLPPGMRKIIFATSCAETSFTVDGIKFVVDCGLDREITYDPKKNLGFLGSVVISKKASDQRKSRAGRMASGKCFRLYSESTYASMESVRKPNILREPLGRVILKLAELGTTYEFDFMDAPGKDVLLSTLQSLQYFYAVTPKGITEIGLWMSKLDVDPRLGYMIYLGHKENLLYDCTVIAALIAYGSDIFYRELSASDEQQLVKAKDTIFSEYGDVFTWLNIYQEWLKLPRTEQSIWCQENKVNYKVLNFIKHFVIGIESILKKQENIHMDQEFAAGDQNMRNLRKIIFMSFTSSTCRYLDGTKDGYLELGAERQVHVSTSSSLSSQKVKPKWIVYTEISRTSKTFIKGITVADEDWVMDASNQGKLPVDLDKIKSWRPQLVHREEVGPMVFQHLAGSRFAQLQNLEEGLSSKGMTGVVVEADKPLGTLEIYSSSFMNQDVVRSLGVSKAVVIQKLLEDEEELHIMKGSSGKEQSGIRVLLEKGGLVRAILMPEQSNKIIVKKARSTDTVDEVLEKFKLYGDIKDCTRINHPDFWGYVRYATCQEAQQAVRGTCNDKRLAAALKVETKGKLVRNKFEARLQWNRRPVKGNGTAIIKCPPIERNLLEGRTIVVNDRQLKIEKSRKEGELELFCHNTGDAKELEIKKVLMALLDYDEHLENNIHVSIIREKVKPLSKEMVKQIKSELHHGLKKYLPIIDFNLSLISPKDGAVYQVGHIHFDDPAEGLKACKMASGQISIGGQVVDISPSLKTAIHVPQVIMEALKSRLEDMKAVLNKQRNFQVNYRPLKQGDCAVDIRSSTAEDLLQARDLFQKELEGEIVDCNTKELLTCLLKYKGKKALQDIQQECSVLIMADERKKKIHIYGDVDNVSRAQFEINVFVQLLRTSESKVFALRGAGKPTRLLKEFFTKYTPFPDVMIDAFDLNDVVMDLKQLRITLVGSSESIQKALLSFVELETGLQSQVATHSEKWMPECVLCKTPIENSLDIYRLECCGHSYCHVCIKSFMNLSLQDRKFPLRCALEACNQCFVVKDFRYFLNKKWLSKSSLILGALDSYVARHSESYRFCVTPNCPAVYEVTNNEDGCEWTCPACSSSLCTTCHSVFHAGLPCRV